MLTSTTLHDVQKAVALLLTLGVAAGAGEPSLPDGALHRFGSDQLRHGSAIWNSALSPDGKLLATAAGKSVIVWELKTGRRLHHFLINSSSSYCHPGLTFSPDGRHLGYVPSSYFACVWDVKIGKDVLRLERERGGGGICRFTADGKQFVTTDRKRVRFWDLETGKECLVLPDVPMTFLSPDVSLYVRVDDSKETVIGEAKTGKEVVRLPAAFDDGNNGIIFTPDNKTLALVDIVKKEVQVRELPGGKLKATFPLPDSTRDENTRQPFRRYRVSFSPDGGTLLLATARGPVHRWDLTTRKELPSLVGHLWQSGGVHVLPDGKTAVTTGGDGVVRQWDWKTGRETTEIEGYVGLTCAAYSPDGRWVAVGDQRGRVDLWDAHKGKKLQTLRKDGPEVRRVAFTPDGKLLGVGEGCGAVELFQVPSGKKERTFAWESKHEGDYLSTTLLFSPDGKRLGVSDYSGKVRMLDVVSGRELYQSDLFFPTAFAPDGTVLITGMGNQLSFRDPMTGKRRSLVELEARAEPGRRAHCNTDALATSPDGRWVAAGLTSLEIGLLSGEEFPQYGHIALYDLRGGREVRRFFAVERPKDPRWWLFVDGFGIRVTALDFSPDGKWLLSGGGDGLLRVWEVATGKELLRRAAHEGDVSTVAFSPDARTALTCGRDSQVILWSLKPPGDVPKPAAVWDDLASLEPATAYRAVWALRDDVAGAKWLGEKVSPVKPVDGRRVARLIDALNSGKFAERDAAMKELKEIGRLAGPAMREALKDKPTLELRKRLEELLQAMEGELSAEELRVTRLVQALELARTKEARALLKEWAAGAPGALLTDEATAALRRIERR